MSKVVLDVFSSSSKAEAAAAAAALALAPAVAGFLLLSLSSSFQRFIFTAGKYETGNVVVVMVLVGGCFLFEGKGSFDGGREGPPFRGAAGHPVGSMGRVTVPLTTLPGTSRLHSSSSTSSSSNGGDDGTSGTTSSCVTC